MKRIQKALQQDKKLLSIYFTAGFPNLDDTIPVLKSLEENGVDIVEIGLPFSDPLADGPTIQNSSQKALQNGINLDIVFDQLMTIKETNKTPLVLMGYLNQLLKYGEEKFCQKVVDCGIDTLILPDLPMVEYENHYKALFDRYGINNVFLITPQTSDERIKQIDEASNAFIYMVSSASVTGSTSGFGEAQQSYFKRIKDLNLTNPQIVGFGIKDEQTFKDATANAKGAIIGSAFIKHLTKEGVANIPQFVKTIR